MVITIFDSAGKELIRVTPDDSSTQEKQVMGDNALRLSFKHHACTVIGTNSYADFMGERYYATGDYKPQMKSAGEWQYDVTLYGTENLLSRFLVLETTDGDANPEFTLTGTPREHAALIVESVNAALGTTDFKVGEVDGETENIALDYYGVSCSDALKQLADALETEWWLDGQTVNVCRCEHGSAVALGYGTGLTGIERQQADNSEPYTRLFVMGSTRNIDPEKYGHQRLQLPGNRKYVEVNVEKYGIIDRYEKDAFADIYPRYTGTVESVRTTQGRNDDGTDFTVYWIKDSQLPFNPDDYMLSDGSVIRLSFQSGELNGLGSGDDHYFEANWHEDGKEFEIITQWPYEDGGQLPGGTLIPKAGDKYIPWNFRMPDEYVTAAEQELLSAAVKYNERNAKDISVYKCGTDHVYMERLTDGDGKPVTLKIGQRVRLESMELFPDAGYRDSRITKISRHVTLPGWMDLEIGDTLSRGTIQKMGDDVKQIGVEVRSMDFPDIVRSWETTQPSDYNVPSFLMVLKQIAEKALSRLHDDTASGLITFLKGLVSKAKAVFYAASGTDSTAIEAHGNVEVKGGAVIADDMHSASYNDTADQAGHGFHITNDGGVSSLWVDNLTVRKKWTASTLEVLKLQYSAGNITLNAAGGEIFAVVPYSGDGKALAQTTDSDGNTVYIEAASADLINAIADGDLIADGTQPLADNSSLNTQHSTFLTPSFFRCYFRASDGERNIMNEWHVGDIARCQTFNLSDGEHLNAANRRYGRVVIGVASETTIVNGLACFSIDLSNATEAFSLTDGTNTAEACIGLLHTESGKTSTIVTNDEPLAGDNVSQVGSVLDKGRQGAVQLVAAGDGSPAIRIYSGVNEALDDLSRFTVYDLNPDSSLINTRTLTFTNGTHTNKPFIQCGTWEASPDPSSGRGAQPGEVYQYNGSSWYCNAETTSAPNDTDTYTDSNGKTQKVWTLLASKGVKGDKGDRGEQGIQGEKGEQGDKGDQGIQGEQGIPGNDGHSPTVAISDDGYWTIDGTKTSVKAEGTDGHTPTVTIGSDGYWYIDGVKTDTKAQGDKGADAVTYYITPSPQIIQEKTDGTEYDNTTGRITAKSIVYDMPDTFVIYKKVGTAETKTAATSIKCSDSTLLRSDWEQSMKDGYTEKGYWDISTVCDATSLQKDTTLTKFTLTFTLEDGATIDVPVYINRIGTTVSTTVGDATETIRTKTEYYIENDSAAVKAAKTAADKAQSSADAAQTSADNAQSAADNAQSSADAAKKTADANAVTLATYTAKTDANAEALTNVYTKTETDDKDNAISKQVSEVEQTATDLTTRVTTNEGDISTLKQTSTELTTKVTNNEGDISTLKETVGGLQSTVSTHDGKISTLEQDSQSISATVTAQGNVLTALNITDKGIEAVGKTFTWKNTDGATAMDMDGAGNAVFSGMLRLSTNYAGEYTAVNLFYLPAIASGSKTITLGTEREDIGKVVRLVNSSAFGGGTYIAVAKKFSIAISEEMDITSDLTTLSYYVRPQEVVELTCFQTSGTQTGSIGGEWVLTGRFSQQDFRQETATGRFPRMAAMGVLSFRSSDTEESLTASVRKYDGTTASITVTHPSDDSYRTYVLSFPSGTFPSGYIPMLTPIGRAWTSIVSYTSTQITVFAEDNTIRGAVLQIYDPYWWYNLKS